MKAISVISFESRSRVSLDRGVTEAYWDLEQKLMKSEPDSRV